MDPRLNSFDTVWAAAGTRRHAFPIAPGDLQRNTGATVASFGKAAARQAKRS